MSSIQERINYFSENMSLSFIKGRIGQLIKLNDDVKRYIQKDIKNESKILFTSQDLRSLIIGLEKVHKQVNKNISYTEIEKRLNNRCESVKKELLKLETKEDVEKHKKKQRNAYAEETKYVCGQMALARDLQMLISCFNYFALDTRLIEKINEKKKQDDDNIFKEELEFILFDLMKDDLSETEFR